VSVRSGAGGARGSRCVAGDCYDRLDSGSREGARWDDSFLVISNEALGSVLGAAREGIAYGLPLASGPSHIRRERR